MGHTIKSKKRKGKSAIGYFCNHKWLYLMMLPGLIYYFIFAYMPMEGLCLAFNDYSPMAGGIRGNQFAGLKYFKMMFSGSDFKRILTNTLSISLLNLVFGFSLPIILSLLLNELKNGWFKKAVQNIIYIPHFFSWVIVVSICYQMFTVDGGAINNVIHNLTGQEISFLSSPHWLRPLVICQNLWKEAGWGTIIYLAAMSSIDESLYEAAEIDGGNRWHKMRYITLPGISLTIATMLILSVGAIMSSNFDQMFLVVNSSNRSVGDVFDTYIYEQGIRQGRFSLATAMGMFKSVVAFILVLTANKVSDKLSGNAII